MRHSLLLVALGVAVGNAQTTQGLISGNIADSHTGRPVANAAIAYAGTVTSVTGSARSDGGGRYILPLLPPGTYWLRVTADRYQPQEVYELELAVAARHNLDFRLRPMSDVWEAGRYGSVYLPASEAVVTFFGPDVDMSRSGSFEASRGELGALEATVSHVIDPEQVRELPLDSRDIYAMLVVQPGVTADAGTARGLGLSVNGQRPSASTFLLDGLENNNYLLTGPLAAIAPEAVQEYRMTTNSFSAEYGRTAGLLANAVTRSGGSEWHATLYGYVKNDALNANDFQANLSGLPRRPLKEAETGFHAGGPLPGRRLFFSIAWDRLRSRTRSESVELALLSPSFREFTAPGSIARGLIERFPSIAPDAGNVAVERVRVAPAESVDRSLALQRLDYIPAQSRHRVTGRWADVRLDRPDFVWSPYPDFRSGMEQRARSLAVSHVAFWRPDLTNELRAAWSADRIEWDRAHPEIPAMFAGDGAVLPGSPAFYDFRNHSRNLEISESLLWTPGRHVLKAGGGLLFRRLDGYLTAGRDGAWGFRDFLDFALDRPTSFAISLARGRTPAFAVPDYRREYRYRQKHFFLQDTLQVSGRLALNFGLRFEDFGAPENTGSVRDTVVRPGPGGDLTLRIASATLEQQASGDLYRDRGNWAGRFGFSYRPFARGSLLLRGSYGLFFDRPFDNLWLNLRNNGFVLASFAASRSTYVLPAASALTRFQSQPFASDFPRLTMFDPNLRDPYAQSWFLGVQRHVTESWSVEVDALGSLGRRLLTTDQLNRQTGAYNRDLPVISYRAGQGLSDYNALAALARYRASRGQLQIAYTWSHSIDLQSDPLAGDFFDLSFARPGGSAQYRQPAAFARAHESRGDRGSSDFDQRHNLILFSLWQLPQPPTPLLRRLFGGYRFSQMASFRSGFPYTVFAPATLAIFNNRADLRLPGPAESSTAMPGGMRLLDPAAFQAPAAGSVGNTGRNAFRGPGLFNVDVSLSRSFVLPRLREGSRITFRADAFTVLNHANLNNPDAILGSTTFGIASYGRIGRDAGFPGIAPWRETPRQIQLMLRVEF